MTVRTTRLFESVGELAVAVLKYTVPTGMRTLVKQLNVWVPANCTVTVQMAYGGGTPRTFLVRAVLAQGDLLLPLYHVLNAGDAIWLANSPALGARTTMHGVEFVLP